MMTKRTRRSIATMAQGAIASQTDDLLAQKDEIIETLKQQLADAEMNTGEGWVMLPVDQIYPMQIEVDEHSQPRLIRQPRRYFDPDKIAVLADSIATDGLKEPIIVRQGRDGSYEIMDGERRLRSHQLRGLPEIKAIIRQGISDDEALQYALTTDALKEKISPLEQAIAAINLLCLRLQQDEESVKKLLYALQNEAVGNRKKGSKPIDQAEAEVVYGVLNSLGIELGAMVNNRLPLLALPTIVRQAVEAGDINPTNAILIARAPSQFHEHLLEQGKGLSKRKLKVLIATLTKPQATPTELNNGFMEQPMEIYEASMNKLKRVSKSPLIQSDKKAKKLLLAAYEQLDALEQYIDSVEARTGH